MNINSTIKKKKKKRVNGIMNNKKEYILVTKIIGENTLYFYKICIKFIFGTNYLLKFKIKHFTPFKFFKK